MTALMSLIGQMLLLQKKKKVKLLTNKDLNVPF